MIRTVLLRFRVENYRSFKEPQELSLIAGSLADDKAPIHRSESLGVGVLPVAALYGANASGKTNVFKALAYMDNAIENSQRTWRPDGPIPFEPFRFSQSNPGTQSTFDVDLLLGGTRFTYGFSLNASAILREWLYAYPSGKRQTWFTREHDRKPVFSFGKHLTGENRSIESLTRPNSLFLSAAAQNNHTQLLPIYQWFTSRLQFVSQERSPLVLQTAKRCLAEPAYKQEIVRLLAAADLGIIDLEVSEEPIDGDVQEAVNALLARIAEKLAPENAERPTTKVDPLFLRTRLKHKTASSEAGVPLQIEDESAGTIAWLGLLGPALTALKNGGTVVVDELDASLHPLLALQLVQIFNDQQTNQSGAQLVFNTHDTNLLDQSVLRRDQIWFIEKDDQGASHLYPLTDFKPRKDENLKRGYLQGRYGAIPYVRSIELVG
jgi:AAA15 family ATPase/GTPase